MAARSTPQSRRVPAGGHGLTRIGQDVQEGRALRRFGRRSESAEVVDERPLPPVSSTPEPEVQSGGENDTSHTDTPRSPAQAMIRARTNGSKKKSDGNYDDFADNLVMEGPKAPPKSATLLTRRGGVATAYQESGGLSAAARARIDDARNRVRPLLMDFMDVAIVAKLSTRELTDEISDVVPEICAGQSIQLNASEQQELIQLLINELIGLGPIEPLLADESISEVMINGPEQIYVERNGLIELTDIKYDSALSLMNAATRIVSRIGRRVDESSPICDARLADGSRVNVIIPPLALRGPTITIRKFKKDKLTLEKLVEFGTITPEGAELLKIIAACRCNVLISGGTGSGKTTLLNCMTRYIDHRERVITCEDAAELQLQQPHWVPLETRPPNIEGQGAVTMRELVRNCLRMRPERIIVGEVRGPEAFDLLQAMNTGHDGSMGTLHANTPREAINRLENMIAMANLNISAKAMRDQISSALHLVIQVQRLRDGTRRVTHVTEVMGSPGDDVVTMQDLFVFKIEGEDANGRVKGHHEFSGLRPAFWDRARYFGLDRQLGKLLKHLV
jgi:pilus assembly protein CpaF